MGRDKKMAYLKKIRPRYKKANRKLKAQILEEFCLVCDYNRKHAIRLLNCKQKTKRKKQPGARIIYNKEHILEPLARIWLATDQICSKRLRVAIKLWLPFYEDEYGCLDHKIKKQLLSISASTIDRLLKPIKIKHKRKGLSGTKPGTLLKNQIPIKTNNWDVNKPGFVEADTVAHCGNSMDGDFVWSLTLTDIHTSWTENRAVWGKGSSGVVSAIKNIESKLPFNLLGFDCDNGSEFLNWHLIRYFSDRPKKKIVKFTRSRPYRKNDNAHVEQKNWTHVRQLFGYHRFENKELIPLINNIYANEKWNPFINLHIFVS